MCPGIKNGLTPFKERQKMFIIGYILGLVVLTAINSGFIMFVDVMLEYAAFDLDIPFWPTIGIGVAMALINAYYATNKNENG